MKGIVTGFENEIVVNQVYKGDIKGEIIVHSYLDTNGEYLFFANNKSNGGIQVVGGEPCSQRSPTMLLSEADNELKIIKFLQYYPIYALILLLLFLGWYIKKKRKIK